MHILHIFNSYGGTSVYYNLILEFDKIGVRQTVFVPLNPKNHQRIGNFNVDFKTVDSKIIYSTALKKYHRYFYEYKICTIVKAISRIVDMSEVSVINAGMFCSDGAVAYELSKQYGIPYITSIRNTDIGAYYKKLFWKRNYFAKVLRKSSKIIFISPQYQYRVLVEIISPKLRELIEHKTITIPNGVSSVFLDKRKLKVDQIHTPAKILYAGAFQRGKNIEKIIDALVLISEKGILVEFTAIGRGLKNRNNSPEYINMINSMAEKYPWVILMDSVNQSELIELMKDSDVFVMPSVPETFGLVYVEALSQGLPIIYAKGEGFDGYYPEGEIGFGVNANDPNDIADKLEKIIRSHHQFSENVTSISLRNFSWKEVAQKYYRIIKEINENRS